jgi:signal transduction histidine kinase
VFTISTWIGSRMSHMLWEAKRRIGIQNQRILQQNTRLKELDRAKNVFTASVAHDLRTPLAVATSLAEALAKEELSGTARNRLESLATSLAQLRRQSDNLFDLERFQLGVTRLDPCEVDLVDWIRHFEEGFASIARARDIGIPPVSRTRLKFKNALMRS